MYSYSVIVAISGTAVYALDYGGVPIKSGIAGTDDTAVIQAAINNIKANGGKLHISRGTYQITSALSINGCNNVTIEGDGIGSTILKASGTPLDILRKDDTASLTNFMLKELEIDGNAGITAPAYINGFVDTFTIEKCYLHDSNGFVIFFDTVSGNNKNINLLNSTFKYSGAGYDIVGSGGTNIHVINCTFINDETKPGEGYAVTNGRQIEVIGCKFIPTATGKGFNGNAVHTEGNASSDIRVIGNHMYMYSGYGIDFGGDTGTPSCQRAVIADNIIDGSAGFAYAQATVGSVNIRGVRDCQISANTFNKTNQYGVRAFDVEDLIVSDNNFIDAAFANAPTATLGDSTAQQTPAIAVLNSTSAVTNKKHIKITDNIVRNIAATFSAGVIVDSQYTDVDVSGNDLNDAATPKQYVISTPASTIITDNYGVNPVNLIANPFTASNVGYRGNNAGSANPTANTDYTVSGYDIVVNSTGGAGVSITIKDGVGNVITSGTQTLNGQRIPRGYKVNFGAFTGAPTVMVFGE